MKPLRYLCIALLAACAALAPPVAADPALVSTIGVAATSQDAQVAAPALFIVEAPQAIAPATDESPPTADTTQATCVAYVMSTTSIALVRPEVRASALRRA